MSKRVFKIIVTMGMLITPLIVNAQQKNYVVEKVVNEEVTFPAHEQLKIIAEKASVRVSGWEKNSVRMQLKLIAKHPIKAIAEKELNYMKYGISKEKNSLSLSNIFAIPVGVSGIQSSLEVQYELMLPFGSSLDIINRYGDITLTGLTGKINLDIEFGDIRLQQLNAQLHIQSSYSEIRGNNIDGRIFCKSDKSAIYLESLKGVQIFNSTYGTISLSFQEGLQGLTIKASRTAITLGLKSFEKNNYNLHTTYSSIYLPDQFKKYIKKSGQDNISLELSTGQNHPLLKVNTTYSPITLQLIHL